MRIFTVTALCLCIVLTGCTGKNGENKPSPAVIEESNVLGTNDQGTEQTGVIDEEVPLEVKVDELGPFQKGISFGDLQFDEKYQEIYLLFQKNIKAWVAKDKESFRECFISIVTADEHMFFIEDLADYEFVGTPYIIDQSSENGRINISFSYRTSDQVDEIRGYTTTFKKDEDNIWKISLID